MDYQSNDKKNSSTTKSKGCFQGIFKGKHTQAKSGNQQLREAEESVCQLKKELENVKKQELKLTEEINSLKRQLAENCQTKNLQEKDSELASVKEQNKQLQEKLFMLQKEKDTDLASVKEENKQLQEKAFLLQKEKDKDLDNVKKENEQLQQKVLQLQKERDTYLDSVKELQERLLLLQKQIKKASKELQINEEGVQKIIHVYGDACSVQNGDASQMFCNSLDCLENIVKKLVTEHETLNRELERMKTLAKRTHNKIMHLCKDNKQTSENVQEMIAVVKDLHGHECNQDYKEGFASLQNMQHLTIPVTAKCIPFPAMRLYNLLTAKYAGVKTKLLRKLLDDTLPDSHLIRNGDSTNEIVAEWLVVWAKSNRQKTVDDLMVVVSKLDEQLMEEEERQLKDCILGQPLMGDVARHISKRITLNDILSVLLKNRDILSEILVKIDP